MDFTSQEPVVIAVVTQCKEWLYIFENKLDLYSCIANDMYKEGIDIHGPIEEVRAKLTEKFPKLPKDPNNPKDVAKCAIRDDSKTCTLAISYGQSAKEFSKRTGMHLDKVERFYKLFDERYPEIKVFKNKVEALVNAGKTIETMFGCKRSSFLTKVGDPKVDMSRKNRLYRQLINFLIQQVRFVS